MHYQLVIFDFDGTLADSARWFHANINAVARRYRFREIQAEDVEALRGQDTASIIRHLGVPRWKLPFIAAHMRKMMARDLGEIGLFPGVPAMLAALHRSGLRLAIVSSNAPDNVRRMLGPRTAASIDHYGCGTSLFGKSAKFRLVLKQAGLAPSQAIAIGDELRDIEAARDVGIASGAVAWGYAAPSVLAARSPDVFFGSVEEIVPYLLRAAPEAGADRSMVPLTPEARRR